MAEITEERFRKINNIRVIHPYMAEIMKKLTSCHTLAMRRPEPPCMVVTGIQGVGKTTLYKTYAERYPRVETDEGTIVPCLTATIPVPATVSSLVSEILYALGDVEPEMGNVANRTKRLRRLLKECGTEIIFLDEFQHFIDRDSERVLKTTADWLKNLLNQTGIPIVLLGMPSCTHILESNPQLKRRFSIRMELRPFEWATSVNGITDYPLRKLLKVVEKQLPLNLPSNLSDPETAYRIFAASGGVIDSIMKLIRGAAELAVLNGGEKITLDLLAEVYNDELSANQPNIPNNFITAIDKVEVVAPYYIPGQSAQGNPLRKRRI